MSELGVNIVSIAIYIILFCLLYLAVDGFLIKKIEGIVAKRENDLGAAKKTVSEASSQAGSLKKEAEGVLELAKQDAQTILEQSRKQATLEKEAILSEARERSKKVLLEADKLIEFEKARLHETQK